MFYAVHGQRDLPHSMERRSAHAQPDLAHSWRAGLSMPRLNCRSVGAQTDLARSLSLSLSLARFYDRRTEDGEDTVVKI